MTDWWLEFIPTPPLRRLQVYQGAMVHITADVTHTVRAITPTMLMATIMRS